MWRSPSVPFCSIGVGRGLDTRVVVKGEPETDSDSGGIVSSYEHLHFEPPLVVASLALLEDQRHTVYRRGACQAYAHSCQPTIYLERMHLRR